MSFRSSPSRLPLSKRLASGRQEGLDRGSVVLEFAILVPVVLVMIFLCIQVALYSYARSVAITAAEEGVNAQRSYNAAAGTGYARAQTVIERQGDTLSGWSIDAPAPVGGELRITVQGTSLSVLPGVPGFHVSQTASGPVEQFTP